MSHVNTRPILSASDISVQITHQTANGASTLAVAETGGALEVKMPTISMISSACTEMQAQSANN